MVNVLCSVFTYFISFVTVGMVTYWLIGGLQNAPEVWPPEFCGNTSDNVNKSCAAGLSADWSGNNIGSWEVWNWHPFLMTIAYGAMASQAIMSFRSLPFSKSAKKVIHALSHLVAVGCSTTAIAVAILFKNYHGLDHFYSVHSWLGMMAYATYTLQFLLGIIFFIFPKLSAHTRAKVLPYHSYFGKAIFMTTTAALTSGFVNRLLITGIQGRGSAYALWNMVANGCVLSIILTTWCVSWHIRHTPKKRDSEELYHYSPINNSMGGFNYD